MARTTIDFGIDLGTTNSVIACMDKGELVTIKDGISSSEVTPSVVKVDARGSVIVGQNAYNELEYDPENVVSEFKRWMGNPAVDGFTFRKSQKRMTAAELSAEVLKKLKASASLRFGEDLNAAVITVPAMFLIPACEDTKAAARLAGLEVCPLLQEPVAAAMAYGYKAENLRGNLLVFDLGGGTFDTTLIAARENRLIVLGHDGDDKLGGKDFDWALVALIIQRLNQEYGSLSLSRDGSTARAMAKLKYLAEDAKKTLSVLEEVAVDIRRLEGGFENIDTVVQISRRDLEQATAQLTERCIAVCRRLLKQSRLSGADLEAVLLVGGQTKMPYIREAVADEFGRADARVDNMTVVAAGAALFAATQRMPAVGAKPAAQTGIELKVAYSPVATDLDADVGISLESCPPGATVTIVRHDGGWSSGAIPAPASGKVVTTVVLRARKANSFEIRLQDASGASLPARGGAFTITHGFASAQATTSRAFVVALENNEAQVIIPKGVPLPAKGTQKFLTARPVTAGDRRSALKIYVLEGDDPRSDRNFQIGEITLRGDEIHRSLSAGEAVEVTYRLDESKTLSVEAVFPVLREARQMSFQYERPALSSGEIEQELQKEKGRLGILERAVPEKIGSEIGRQIGLIEKEKNAAQADDPDARQKAAQQLIELKQAVDALIRSAEWELLLAGFEQYGEDTRKVAEAHGTDAQKLEVREALKTANTAIAGRNLADLRDALQRLENSYWTILYAQDDFWKSQFNRLNTETEFVDPLRAERLREEGMRALKRNDVSSLRTIVRDLYGLLPAWQQGKLDNRFRDAGLRRARSQTS